MATHRPIVSTPIRDVERFYSEIVYLADTAASFVSQIDLALHESDDERARRRALEDRILAEHSWDLIASRMDRHMLDAYSRQARLSDGDVAIRRAAQAARAHSAAPSQIPSVAPVSAG